MASSLPWAEERSTATHSDRDLVVNSAEGEGVRC